MHSKVTSNGYGSTSEGPRVKLLLSHSTDFLFELEQGITFSVPLFFITKTGIKALPSSQGVTQMIKTYRSTHTRSYGDCFGF